MEKKTNSAKVITRFFTQKGNFLSFESHSSSKSMLLHVDIGTGKFTIDNCDYDLLTARDEIDICLRVVEKLGIMLFGLRD